MVSHHVAYQLVLWALIWFCIIVLLIRPTTVERAPATPVEPEPIKAKRPPSTEPKPFEGLTQKPPCPLCERETVHPHAPPPVPPDPMPATHRRPRAVDTFSHCCPYSKCN